MYIAAADASRSRFSAKAIDTAGLKCAPVALLRRWTSFPAGCAAGWPSHVGQASRHVADLGEPV
jgi:hypothetical protein